MIDVRNLVQENKRDFKGVFIPKDLWIDTNLTPTEMKLLVEINALDKGDGAYASNAHYSEILNREIRQIQNLLKDLFSRNYITITGKGKGRRLFSNHAIHCTVDSETCNKLHHNHAKNCVSSVQEIAHGVKHIVKHIDTSTNTSDYFAFLIKLYKDLYAREFGINPAIENYPKMRVMLKPLLSNYTQVQATAIMFAHFEWRGIDGKDELAHKKLKNAGFPLAWISNGLNNYITYLINTAKADFEDDEKLKPLVVRWMKTLTVSNS